MKRTSRFAHGCEYALELGLPLAVFCCVAWFNNAPLAAVVVMACAAVGVLLWPRCARSRLRRRQDLTADVDIDAAVESAHNTLLVLVGMTGVAILLDLAFTWLPITQWLQRLLMWLLRPLVDSLPWN